MVIFKKLLEKTNTFLVGKRALESAKTRHHFIGHCTAGQNQVVLGHLIIHFPTSEGVSGVSKRANECAQQSARAKRAVWSKRTSEHCEQTSERTSKWPSAYVPILGCSAPLCTEFFFSRLTFVLRRRRCLCRRYRHTVGQNNLT